MAKICSGGASSGRRVGKRMKKRKAAQLHDLPDILLLAAHSFSIRYSCRRAVAFGVRGRRTHERTVEQVEAALATVQQKEPGLHQGDNVPAQKPGARRRRLRQKRRQCATRLRQLSPTDPRDKFVLEFRFIQSNVECYVDQWVAFCAASTAKDIVFDFNPGSWGTYWLSFPLKHFRNGSPAIRSLHLMSGARHPPAVPPDFCGFTNLRELKLDSVLGDIHCLLLPAFSVLEWLSVTRCTLHSFSTSQPLGRLRYMCVQYCHMHELEVQAPKLAKFEFASFEVHPVFVLMSA
uniref:At1g61320/AtMIF1 LRR domain-containing protein n=1 Tax=Aegilops tauschii TaxID=37682 RepID=M8C485_AEGTA